MTSQKKILTTVAIVVGVALFVGAYVLVGVALDVLSTPDPRGMACKQISQDEVYGDVTSYALLPPERQETFKQSLNDRYAITISKSEYDYFDRHPLIRYQNQTYDCYVMVE